MPKGRHLKPEFFTDRRVVSVSPLARLLYQGLWCYAHDCGHLDDEPVELKMRILPADNCDVGGLLDELVGMGRVERGGGVLFLPKLRDHARIDRRYETVCDACKARRDHDVTTTGSPSPKVPHTTGTRSDHDGDTTGTHGDHVDDGDGDGDGDGDRNTCSPAEAGRTSDIESDFAAWYETYPRKQGRGQALRAYKTARKKVTADTLTAAVADQRGELTRKGRDFCPLPATWLNGERWADETNAATVTPIDRSRLEPNLAPPSGLSNLEYARWEWDTRERRIGKRPQTPRPGGGKARAW